MDGIWQFTSELLAALSPGLIYDQAWQIAHTWVATISGILLVFAMMFRAALSQFQTVAGNGQGVWVKAFAEMCLYAVVLAVYFGAAYGILQFIHALEEWTARAGSVDAVFSRFANHIQSLKERTEAETWGESISQAITSASMFGPRLIALVFYYAGQLLVLATDTFLGLARALLFGVALWWGALAIPMAITSKFSMLKGWGILSAVAISWPIVENVAMWFLMAPMDQVFDTLETDYASVQSVSLTGLYLGMTIFSLVMAATIIAAPFISHSLVSNAGSIGGVVGPFAGAAMAATAAVAKTASTGTGSQIGAAAKNLGQRTDQGLGRALGMQGSQGPASALMNQPLSAGAGTAGAAASPLAKGGEAFGRAADAGTKADMQSFYKNSMSAGGPGPGSAPAAATGSTPNLSQSTFTPAGGEVGGNVAGGSAGPNTTGADPQAGASAPGRPGVGTGTAAAGAMSGASPGNPAGGGTDASSGAGNASPSGDSQSNQPPKRSRSPGDQQRRAAVLRAKGHVGNNGSQ
jgi:hypothetical protein